jgi:hypothetical protein
MPTNKWLAATVIAAGTLVTAILQTGWDTPTQIALVGFLVERTVAYLLPNQPPVVNPDL